MARTSQLEGTMGLQSEAKRVSIHAIVCFLVWACLLGCSSERAGEGELARTRSEPLTFPVTVTLTAPKNVAPKTPVLNASNSVRIGARVDVVSGMTVAMGNAGVSAEPDALLNETWSRGTAVLKDRVKVRGTLHARTRTLGIGATVTQWDQNPVFDPVSTLSWKVSYPGGPVHDIIVDVGASERLLPGKYGSVTLNSSSRLTLVSGTYYLTRLTLEASTVVELDQANGPVIIYVTDSFTFRGSFVPLSGTDPNLLIVSLGTAPIFLERVFNGAIVAPSASITLRSVSAAHVGFFYAKDLFPDAGAKIKYRAPNAIDEATKPPGPVCFTFDDTDADGFLDCVDKCPYDSRKTTSAGRCGCGHLETDSDGDTTPDCIDFCESDPNNVYPGECGCVGRVAGVKPAGTPCRDSACPQAGATCNEAGVCGNRSACRPATNCTVVMEGASTYWLCPGPVTRNAASQACNAKGMHLLRVDSFSENRFITKFLNGTAWIGANSISTANRWRWAATPNNNNGDRFWEGGATGTPVNDGYSDWTPGAPGTNRCATLRSGDGTWVDTDCNQTFGYVCEFRIPIDDEGGVDDHPPGITEQPVPEETECVPDSESLLPDNEQDLLTQIELTEQGITEGAAADPPEPGETCVENPKAMALGDFANGAGCEFTNVQVPAEGCFTDQNCSDLYGADYVCRQVKDDPDCQAPTGPNAPTEFVEGQTCPGHSACGIVVCDPPPEDPPRCDRIEICNPGSEVDAEIDPGHTLDPEEFDPDDLFGTAVPPTPSPEYVDEPLGDGKNHAWCKMTPQNELPAAEQPSKGTSGTSGGNSKLSVGFDPDLVFKVNANPMALGENAMGLHAAASLVASVHLNDFLGQSYDADIINAVAGITAERCTISNTETQLSVFGVDFVDPEAEYIFDTSDTEFSQKCSSALETFAVVADRAKKAFRDAQQLLRQYQTLKGAGNALQNLCQNTIGLLEGTNMGFFPGGYTCAPNETPEITINRFLDYYQAPGYGQVSRLREGMAKLSKATKDLVDSLPSAHIEFLDINKQESQTILNVPFAIGPVPMVLQIDVFYSYGIAGGMDLELKFPFSLETPVGTPLDIAFVKAGVLPHASAGLSAFVGAGGGLGGFSATLGIEGNVTLGEIKAPIFAGAGLKMIVTDDIRPIPEDIGPPVALALNAFQFNIPKAFKFFAWYKYGAALDVKNILAGEIKAGLRIKFFFFSRSWRKRVVKFNGWNFHFDLVSGSAGDDPKVSSSPETVKSKYDTASTTTNAVDGTTALGVSEPEVPLMVLAPLDPADHVPGDEQIPFNTENVEKLFYDDLCCAKRDEPCRIDGSPQCCPDSVCIPNGGEPGTGVCGFECREVDDECQTKEDCCGTLVCNSLNSCAECGDFGVACDSNADCCNNFSCIDNECFRCKETDEPCTTHAECCGDGISFGCGITSHVCGIIVQ